MDASSLEVIMKLAMCLLASLFDHHQHSLKYQQFHKEWEIHLLPTDPKVDTCTLE